MKLRTLSEVAQIVSALAVVVSLVYVGVEIRKNTEASRAATRQGVLQADLEYLGATLDPQTLLSAATKLESGDELSAEENFILIERQHVNFRLFENAFSQHRAGLLEDERWETYRWIMSRRLAEDAPTRAMWEKYGTGFDAGFHAEVETIRSSPFVPRDTGRAP